MKNTILLTHVKKTYQTPAGDVPVLSDINLTASAGEFIGIIGKSGAGKSTLINITAGIDGLTSGNVNIENTAVHELNSDQCNSWRGKNIGIVYQSFELLHQISVLENVLLPLDFAGKFHPMKSKERGLELLRKMEIEEHANKYPSDISGGQQQRVAIARALVNNPPVILADEPTGNLDSQTSKVILGLFKKLTQTGTTILMVTHNSQDIDYFSSSYELKDGVLILNKSRRTK